MPHTQAKGQGRGSLGSKVRVEKDGRTIALPPVLTRSVIRRGHCLVVDFMVVKSGLEWP